jgi:glycosyltransferase involved in cell wall biosynthesis
MRPAGAIFRVMDKYQGQSTLMYVWSYLKFFLKSAFFLAGRSLRDRYDVVHIHNMPNALVFAAIVPKIFGARVMLDVHDLMPANYMAKFNATETSLPVRVLKTEQWLSALFVDNVFCADHNQKDYLADHCGVAWDKITVLLNLPNVEIFKPVAGEKKNEGFRIVYHGTIAHRLGIDLIVRAMAAVVERVPAELWVYGAGDYLPEAIELSLQLGLERKVHFSRSFFPVEQIPEIVTGMDLGIIGNRRNLACDRYMLPVKLLEYVYLGVPVVVPRLHVISRYFDDTMVRFYEPENVEQMADAIVALFGDRDERERLTSSASTFYHKYSIQAQADLYLNLLTGSRVGPQARPECQV